MRRILCFLLVIIASISLFGCTNEAPDEIIATVTETTEVVTEPITEPTTEPITEPTIETTVPETQPEETVPVAANGKEITEILHLKIDALYLRTRPFKSARVLHAYHKGDEIIVTGRSGNGWLESCFVTESGDVIEGYCSNGYHYFEEPWPGFEVNKNDETEEATEPSETTAPTEFVKPTEPTKPIETTPKVEEAPKPTVETEIPIENTDATESVEIVEPTENVDDNETSVCPEALEYQGNYGRLVIPDVNISCQLNAVNIASSEASYLAQHYTDLEDSAAIFQYGDIYVVADHKEQGFARLEDVQKNTLAYIGSGDEIITLYCYKTQYGNNEDTKLSTDKNENGTAFDGYLIYTFSDTKTGYNIFLSYWRVKTW